MKHEAIGDGDGDGDGSMLFSSTQCSLYVSIYDTMKYDNTKYKSVTMTYNNHAYVQ